MSADIVSFYVRLATNPDALADFVRSPRECAERAGLSEADREVVLSGDQGRIHAALRPAAAAAAVAATPLKPEAAAGWPTYYIAYQLTPYGWVATLCNTPQPSQLGADASSTGAPSSAEANEAEGAEGGASSAGATP